MSVDARELVEIIAGERCPCGHLAENHEDAAVSTVPGLHEEFGECRICSCRGVVAWNDDEGDAA